jgi:L-asparaginase II
VVALRPDGSVARAVGVVDQPVFPRSANKPLQAVGLLGCGWQPADDEQLALATASHSGEPRHLEVLGRLLGDLSEADLGCPPQLPLGEQAAHAVLAAGGGPGRRLMNCSGKHAAMLATCRTRGWPLAGYLSADGPLQTALTVAVERLAGEPVRHVAVDGCGAPQHALTLLGLARAYGRLVLAPAGSDERRTADAMRRHPELVGGTGRDVTLLMLGVPGLLAKDGAEGVYAAALPDGSAVALKIQDGAARARVPVLVAALRALGAAGDVLDELATLPVLGAGRQVGEVRVAGDLAG